MNEKILPFEIKDINEVGPTDQPGDIVLVDRAPNVNVLLLCSQNGVKHVVQKSNLNSAAEIDFSSVMVTSPDSFFSYPLSCIFGTENPNPTTEAKHSTISISVERLSERPHILAHFEAMVKRLTSSPALLNDVLVTVDESLTNAVYNAPFVGMNLTSPSREATDLSIDPGHKPLLFGGYDSERVIVGCRDTYGSLNVPDLIDRIKSCYEKDLGEVINFGDGGAGIGSFMMFNSCASMYIGVDVGSSSTICCSFPLKLSATKRSEIPKNIHLIHRPKGL
jgi:hypothetical protein